MLTFVDALRRCERVHIMIHADGSGWRIHTSKAAVKRSEAYPLLMRSMSKDGDSAEDCEGRTLWTLYGDDLVIG